MPSLAACSVACTLFLLGIHSASLAQQACPSGQSRLREGEPCIPAALFNYLYCLSQSGGGKIEVVKKDDTTKSTGYEVNIGGKGSGVVISGEGSGTFKSTETTRAIKELSEKLDPSLTKNCRELSSAIATPSTKVNVICEHKEPYHDIFWVDFDDADRSVIYVNDRQVPRQGTSAGLGRPKSYSLLVHSPSKVGWCEQTEGNKTFLCYEIVRQSGSFLVSEGLKHDLKHAAKGVCEPYVPSKPKI